VADSIDGERPVEFWMIGGGGSAESARVEFRKAVDDTGVAAKLRWWPLLDSGRIPVLYSTVAASGGTVLLTTKNESFGFAALEAMACGCPLVAASAGALPEIVRDGEGGMLYPSGDVAAATARVEEMLDDGELRERLGRGAAAMARERFAAEKCLTDFARAITAVAGDGG
jgi:glycosyltransferase involved in cell wall biosynthesis